MKTGQKKIRRPYLAWHSKDGFSRIAFWQFACFMALILFVWANEIWDFAAILHGAEPRRISVFHALVTTSAIITIAIVTVGNTYLEQKRILSGLLTICSYCRRVRISQAAWQRMDEYLAEHSMIALSHGICPDCYDQVATDFGYASKQAGVSPTASADPHPKLQ